MRKVFLSSIILSKVPEGTEKYYKDLNCSSGIRYVVRLRNLISNRKIVYS